MTARQGHQNTMYRFCLRHSNRGSSRAYRMLLARHTFDRDALARVIDEHEDCADCWHDTALAAVDAAHNLLLGSFPVPDMDAHGNVTGPSVDLCLSRIDSLLECEQRDRRDLEK
jgi:hypothetical protein